MAIVWQKVVKVRVCTNKYQNWRIGAHTKELVLGCGHSNFRKGSVPVPKWARCRECEVKRA